jgi:hypothetical protein
MEICGAWLSGGIDAVDAVMRMFCMLLMCAGAL